jgi:hypothetical protein
MKRESRKFVKCTCNMYIMGSGERKEEKVRMLWKNKGTKVGEQIIHISMYNKDN